MSLAETTLAPLATMTFTPSSESVAGTWAVLHVEPFQTNPSVLVVVEPLTCGKDHMLVGDELPTMASLTVSPVRLSTDGGGVTDVHWVPSQCSASSDW